MAVVGAKPGAFGGTLQGEFSDVSVYFPKQRHLWKLWKHDDDQKGRSMTRRELGKSNAMVRTSDKAIKDCAFISSYQSGNITSIGFIIYTKF